MFNNSWILKLWMSALSLFSMQGLFASSMPTTIRTIAEVDLKRYQGTWYEIAKLPNRFQSECVSNTSAHYTLLPNGDIEVVNRCQRSDGQYAMAKGIAWRPNKFEQGKLKVSFIPVLKYLKLFGGDYWILELDADYSTVMVGSPDRTYLWILARHSQILDHTYNTYLERAKSMGFDITKITRSFH